MVASAWYFSYITLITHSWGWFIRVESLDTAIIKVWEILYNTKCQFCKV